MKELYKKTNENPSLLNFIEIDFDFITKLVEESINDVATKNFINYLHNTSSFMSRM